MFRQQEPSSGRSDVCQRKSKMNKIKTITYVVYN
jgi:hypothetical protein